MSSSVRLLMIEDSKILSNFIQVEWAINSAIQVVGVARDAYEARDLILEKKPDVISIALERPSLGSLQLLRQIMRHYWSKIILIGSPITPELRHQALEWGAVEVIAKPNLTQIFELKNFIAELNRCILKTQQKTEESIPFYESPNHIISLVASTGGVDTSKLILKSLPANFPPVVVAQHITMDMTEHYVRRLQDACALEVCLVSEGTKLEHSKIYVAPGGIQTVLAKNRQGFHFSCYVDRSKIYSPCLDVYLESVLACFGPSSVSAILTGMGSNGVNALLKLREAGAITLAQDEASSLIYGMPKEAVRRGAAKYQMSPTSMVRYFMSYQLPTTFKDVTLYASSK